MPKIRIIRDGYDDQNLCIGRLFKSQSDESIPDRWILRYRIQKSQLSTIHEEVPTTWERTVRDSDAWSSPEISGRYRKKSLISNLIAKSEAKLCETLLWNR